MCVESQLSYLLPAEPLSRGVSQILPSSSGVLESVWRESGSVLVLSHPGALGSSVPCTYCGGAHGAATEESGVPAVEPAGERVNIVI